MPRIASAKSSSSKPAAPVPAPVSHFPTPTPFTYSVPRPTLGQSIKDGFGLGIGASIARNVVDGFFHKPTPTVPATPAVSQAPPLVSSGTSVATEYQKKEYVQCMQTINDHEHCKKLIDEST